jgi:hypothetical protein
MHSVFARRCLSALAFAVTLLALLGAAPQIGAQGGEPQYFAIRGAKIVPVSGPPLENATVVMAQRRRHPSGRLDHRGQGSNCLPWAV